MISKKIINATDTITELLGIYLFVIINSASLYSLFEHKPLFDSIWWAFVTAMTVGYGDTFPVTTGGRILAIILMHTVVLGIIPLVIARLSAKLTVDNNAFTNEEQEELKMNSRKIIAWIEGGGEWKK